MNLSPEPQTAAPERTVLPERLYARFAEVSLELFGAEGTFPMVVPQGQDVDLTVLAFERLDCAVQPGPRDRWITVTSPAL